MLQKTWCSRDKFLLDWNPPYDVRRPHLWSPTYRWPRSRHFPRENQGDGWGSSTIPSWHLNNLYLIKIWNKRKEKREKRGIHVQHTKKEKEDIDPYMYKSCVCACMYILLEKCSAKGIYICMYVHVIVGCHCKAFMERRDSVWRSVLGCELGTLWSRTRFHGTFLRTWSSLSKTMNVCDGLMRTRMRAKNGGVVRFWAWMERGISYYF